MLQCCILIAEICTLPLDNFNVGTRGPDLRGGHGVPSPAQHVLPRLEVTGNPNMVLVDAIIPEARTPIDGALNSPGTALGVGALGHVRLILPLPSIIAVLKPDFSPVGPVADELEHVASKALLSEGGRAIGIDIAQPVGVATAVVDCHECNGQRHAAAHLGRDGSMRKEVDLQSTAAEGPCASVCLGGRSAHGARGPGVIPCRTAERVQAMDAAASTIERCTTRRCPRVLPLRTCPMISTHLLIAVDKVGVRTLVVAVAVLVVAVTTSVRLVSPPRLDVVNSPSSLGIHHGRVALYLEAENFLNVKPDSVLPNWRPHHPAVPMDTRHDGQQKDQEHVEPRFFT